MTDFGNLYTAQAGDQLRARSFCECHSESAMAAQPIKPIQPMIGSISLIG
jgi:hypothetical protein